MIQVSYKNPLKVYEPDFKSFLNTVKEKYKQLNPTDIANEITNIL